MNVIDLLISAFLITGILWGINRGLTRAIGPLVAVATGLVAIQLYPGVSGLFGNPDSLLIRFFAFLFLALLAFVIAGVLMRAFYGVVALAQLGWLDKLLGGFFGAILVILLIGGLLELITAYSFGGREMARQLRKSMLARPVGDFFSYTIGWFRMFLPDIKRR